jgi:hemoglobin
VQSVPVALAEILDAVSGEAGCRRLSAEFYQRVGKDPVLRPLFPGRTLRCATEEFAAFLVQFLGGGEEQTQFRWWLSLRESHARFRVGPLERNAWLKHMRATQDALSLDEKTRKALGEFFSHSSAYVMREEAAEPRHSELAARWTGQRLLDNVIAAAHPKRSATTFSGRARVRSAPLRRFQSTLRARH